MRISMKRTLLSQCVLLALASFAAQAGETPATACQNGDTTQTCGLAEYKDGSFYQDPGTTDAVMANETATNIYMDGHREAGDTQTLTVTGTDMSGHYIQGSNGGTVNINVTDNAKVDMIEVGSAFKTTNTTINVNDATLNGQNSDGTYQRNKDYMMGAAIYLDPLDEGYHNVDISNGSALHGSIISAGQGTQTIAMSDSLMDNGGIYVGSDKSDTSLTLTNATVDATNSQVAQNLDTLVENLSQYKPFQNINVDAFSDLTAATTGSNAEVSMSTDSRVNFGTITGSRNAVVVNNITSSAINQQNIVLGSFTTATATTTPQTAANATFSNGQQEVENRSAAYNYNNDLSIVPADTAPQGQLTADSSQDWNIVFSSSRGTLASDVQGLVAGLDAAEQAGHQVTDDITSHMDRLHFAGMTGEQQEGAQLWGDFLYQNGNFSNDVDYKSITQGAQGGVDWTAYLANGDSVTGGVALAWTRSRVEDTASGPDSFKDTVYGNYYSLYGGWQQALNGRQWGLFADGSFSYGDMRYSLSAHNVTGDTSGMTEALHGSTDGSLYMAQARTGVNVLLPGDTLLQPYAILGWDQTKANGFSDREVTFADSQVSSWNGGAGLRLTTTLTDLNKNVQIMPWLDVRMQKEFSDDTDIQAADYHNTEGHNNSMGMFGAGVNATIAHNFSVNTGIYYGTGDVDNDASVQAGMSYSF